jgi:antitoxin component of MazEF toxin-antitoxin module
MTFYRIKEKKISAQGVRGAAMYIPKTLMKDLRVKIGSTLSLYRGVIGGVPVIILANSDAPELTDEPGAAV